MGFLYAYASGNRRDAICTARCAYVVRTIHNTDRSYGYYMYRLFNVHILYFLPTQFIYVFCTDQRTKSNYFPLLH